MSNGILKRIIADLILLLSVLFMPWWLTVILAFVLVFYFKSYYEFIIAGVLTDALYGVPQDWLFDLTLMYTSFSIVIFIFIQWLKTRLR
ncbi:hypothetical protein ACFL0K_01210 [Patescibacteria group bacterium]